MISGSWVLPGLTSSSLVARPRFCLYLRYGIPWDVAIEIVLFAIPEDLHSSAGPTHTDQWTQSTLPHSQPHVLPYLNHNWRLKSIILLLNMTCGFLSLSKKKFKAHPVFKFLYDLWFRQLASSCLFSSDLAILTSLSLLEHTKDTRPQGLCSGCPSGWRSLPSCIAHSFLPYFTEASVQMPYYQGDPPHPSHPDVPSTMPAVSNVFINWEQWVSVHDAGTIQGGDVPDASHFGFPLPQQKGLCVTCTVLCCKWGQCYLKIPSLDVVSLFSHDMWKHQGHSSKGAVSISPCLLVLLLSLIHLSLSVVHFLKLRWIKQSSNCLPDGVPQPRSLNVALGLDGYSQETCNYYISLDHWMLPWDCTDPARRYAIITSFPFPL